MFDRVFVINLDRCRNRWERFRNSLPENWPFAQPERWPACDGLHCDIPGWFKAGAGAWGCLQSHVAIWWSQIENDWESILILEDDAVFQRHHAVDIMRRTLDVIPEDWDQVYFGGQHLDTNDRPPETIIQDVLIRCRYVNRTHAYAIRKDFACEALDAIDCPNERPERLQHVDYMLGDLHDSHNIYAPWRFCIGQERGVSDVMRNGQRRPKHTVQHWWNQFPIVDPVMS